MDHLHEAKEDIIMAVGRPIVDWEKLAIAHALIALVERLDALTYTAEFPNAEPVKSIRLVAATFGR